MWFLSLFLLLIVSHQTGAAESPLIALVVNTGDDTVSVVDLTAAKEIARHAVGKDPYGIAVSPDGKTVAVGVEGEGKVKFFSYPDFEPTGEVPIGPMHHDHIVRTPDGEHILVANFHSDDVVGIDLERMKEGFRITGASAPHVVKYGPKQQLAYVTCKKITGIAAVDPEKRELVTFHQINVNPRSLTFSPDESRLYFGSFWVDGFFEMDPQSGEVIRLFALAPPPGNEAPQEVTYHGVEAVGPRIVLAANEGRSYLDSVDVHDGKLIDRLHDVSKPCCIEPIPGAGNGGTRVLISNVGDATVQIADVSADGTLESVAKIDVGAVPKRVAFLPSFSLETEASGTTP